jgi:hypothetical protein
VHHSTKGSQYVALLFGQLLPAGPASGTLRSNWDIVELPGHAPEVAPHQFLRVDTELLQQVGVLLSVSDNRSQRGAAGSSSSTSARRVVDGRRSASAGKSFGRPSGSSSLHRPP